MAEVSSIVGTAVAEHGVALMAVVNVTPDSFFDGGRYFDETRARDRVDEVLAAGATIVDIGGESSRPGAPEVDASEQIRRIRPALFHALGSGALVSIDTTSPEVADFALGEGARIVNEISCLRNPELAAVAARHGAALVVTHARGSMTRMPGFSDWPDADYGDVVRDVRTEWEAARDVACANGVARPFVWFDPGLGFSKNARHSFELLRRLGEFRALGTTLVVGPGRKSFLASVSPAPPDQRLGGTIAACLAAVDNGAHVLRVHDVHEVSQAIAVARAAKMAPRLETEAARVR